ncbi:MAG: class I SAM-dependent methyltransferase [Myxococcales bacterium]|nr:class I SAM-dependent methyltransferase [Myxococcales bacterium]
MTLTAAGKPVVLKTDLFNESEQQSENKNIIREIAPNCSKIFAVEIDKRTLGLARDQLQEIDNIELFNDSVTSLPLADGSVDLLLDFSTIDHVIDYRDVLKEYLRVIRKGGRAVLFVWLIEGSATVIRQNPNQCFFNISEFEQALEQHFSIHESVRIFSHPAQEGSLLMRYDLGHDLTWEYLDEMDYRYEEIAKHLSHHAEGNQNGKNWHFVELCCGNGRLPEYLEKYGINYSYEATDLNYFRWGLEQKSTDLEHYFDLSDDEFAKRIDRCDVLVALGHSGFEIDSHPKESSTLTNSISYIIGKFSPEFVVLESISKYHSILKGIIRSLPGYSSVFSFCTTPESRTGCKDSERWLYDRRLEILGLNRPALWVAPAIYPYNPKHQDMRPHAAYLPTGRTPRNLVIATTGDRHSCHTEWLEGQKNFDLMLVNYGEPGLHSKDADYFLDARGFKLEITRKAIDHYQEELTSYDSIWLPDDDLSISTAGINRLFSTFHEFQLDLAQPAIANAENYSFGITVRQHDFRLRFVNFVEVGRALFRRSALLQLLDTFDATRSGWGVDLLWAHLLRHGRLAIIDEAPVKHMRPIDLEGGSYYRRLKEEGIDPFVELQQVAQSDDFGDLWQGGIVTKQYGVVPRQ